MKKIIFCILLFIAINTNLKSADNPVYLSAGFKLSYAWGQYHNGFLWGIEVSTVTFTDYGIYGPVVNIDFYKGDPIVHLGVEASYAIIGIDLGPTFYLKKGVTNIGIGGSVYTGALVIPYYSYTYFNKKELSFSNSGTLFKYPFLISGSQRSFF